MMRGQKRAVLPRPQDDTKTEAVLRNLAKEAGWFPNVDISVKQGVVVISGHTKNAEQLHWLADTADRIPSVIAVVNKASVDQPPVSDFTPALNESKRLLEKAKKALPLAGLAVILAVIFLFLGKFLDRGIAKLWTRKIQNPFLLATVTRLTMLPIWILFFFLVLQVAGLSSFAATIIGGTGVLGIVIGFAFKDIAENYISGLILSVRSPFTKGDVIILDKFEGYVQNLSMRGTTILDYNGAMILIPNRVVLQSVIQNISVNPKSRISFFLHIALTDSIPRAQDLIYQALKGIPEVLNDPAPTVVATEVTKSSVALRVLIWYETKGSKFQTTSKAIAAGIEALRSNGFQMVTDIRSVVETVPEGAESLGAREEIQPPVRTKALPKANRKPANERDAVRINQSDEALHNRGKGDLFHS